MAERPFAVLVRRLPWQVRAVIGAAALGLGLFLVTSPLDALNSVALYVAVSCLLVGLGTLTRSGTGRVDVVVGASWILLGALVIVLPGHAIEVLPRLLAVFLVVSGFVRALGVRSGTLDRRVASLLFGLTEVVLGVLALTWTDVTLLVVAALFGISAALVGLSLLSEAVLHRDHDHTPEVRERGRWRRWGRVLAATIALVLSLGVLWASGGIKNAGPHVDDFYTAPASASTVPGTLLRSELFTSEVPAGATGYRILYTTTDTLDRAVVASGIVLVPTKPGSGPRPVIAWAHGTTGYARQCAPSLLAKPFTDGAFPDVMDQVVERGWAVVATDYAGLGTAGVQPYLIGKGEARSVLDAVRAARSLPGATLDAGKTVVWGHSQGGGAALWAAQEQPTYAQDVPLLGTVAMAPAADPLALAKDITKITGGSVFGAFVYLAYANTYPDLRLADFIKPAAVPLVKKIASRCLSEPGVLASVLTALGIGDENLLKVDPAAGALGAILRDNTPRNPGDGPLLVAQGLTDGLVNPDVTKQYVAQLREDGHHVEFRTYPGLGHMELVQDGSGFLTYLIDWTQQRVSN